MKAALDGIAARAAEHMRREKVGEVVAFASRKGLPLLPAGGALVLLLRATGTPIGALVVLGLAALPYALYVALETVEALFARVSRGAALGRVDAELGLHDRLRAADEFLACAARDSFREAAIADAAAWLPAARAVALPDRGARPAPAGPWAPTTAFLLVVAALLLAPAAPDAAAGKPRLTAALGENAAQRTDPRPERAREPAARVEPPATDEPPAGGAQEKEATVEAGASEKTRRGSAAAGRTARTGGTGAQARSADATGAPSAAGRASAKKLDQTPKESKPGRRKKPTAKTPPPRTPPPRDSGATSGSARSSGSSKNPTASDWKTRDTPPDRMEEPETEDEEVEDESEDSESRGGVQPNLRSRKPPVNRDLGIGFGNRASQRANGRGGASPRKKSRGTASLVLGVPVPDHIKGQPNPGMTKVTRERGEPDRERAEPVAAGARRERSAPTGAVPRAELPPWLQEMMRRYFSPEQDS